MYSFPALNYIVQLISQVLGTDELFHQPIQYLNAIRTHKMLWQNKSAY